MFWLWGWVSIERGRHDTTAGSDAESLVILVSPEVETTAMLVTAGAAEGKTSTASVIVLISFWAMGPGLVQVTICPEAEQVHPVPLAETKLRPSGSISATAIAPVVGAEPTLETVRV